MDLFHPWITHLLSWKTPYIKFLEVITIQLPPSIDIVEGLDALRNILPYLDKGFRYAIEVRHRSWFQDLASGVKFSIVAVNNHYAGFGPGTVNIFRQLLGLEEVKWGDEFIGSDDLEKEDYMGTNKRVVRN